MNTRILYFFCLLGLLTFFSCQKEEPGGNQNPTANHPDQYGDPFDSIPETGDIVMYEINLRAFSQSGDIAGILPRLDSIKALGVNVIWLMPIHPIGKIKSVNSPYSVQNYTEVGSEYGDLDDLRHFVEEAHKRNIAVIMDWVANHTSWDNPWIENKSWYTQDGNGNIIHPAGTNWQDVADLNFGNAEMKQEMIKAMKYWVLRANVDGFRCDAADYVPFAFWKQAIDSLNKIPNRDIIMLAEGAREDHFLAGFQMNFGWDFFSTAKTVFKGNGPAGGLSQSHLYEYANLTAGKHKLRFTSNHDECAWDDTPIGLFGGVRGSMAAFVASTFLGGVPLIYNGQEVGCTIKLPFFSNVPIPWNTNPALFAEYKKLMSAYNQYPALKGSSIKFNFSNTGVLGIRKNPGGKEAIIIINIKNNKRSIYLPSTLHQTTWTNAITGQKEVLPATINLDEYGYKIFVL